jgi:hypothetical protein
MSCTLDLDDEYKVYRIIIDNESPKLIMSFKSRSFKNTGIETVIKITSVDFSNDNHCPTYVYKNGSMLRLVSHAYVNYDITQLQEFYDKFKGVRLKQNFDNAQEIFNFLNQDSNLL